MDTGKPHPDAVKELWEYVNWVVACERREIQKRQRAQQVRRHCLWILQSEQYPDDVAIKQVKGLIS